MFLTPEELATLTGRKRAAGQIAQLKLMGLPFFVNAAGRPIITRAAVEGSAAMAQYQQPVTWTPKPLRKAA